MVTFLSALQSYQFMIKFSLVFMSYFQLLQVEYLPFIVVQCVIVAGYKFQVINCCIACAE